MIFKLDLAEVSLCRPALNLDEWFASGERITEVCVLTIGFISAATFCARTSDGQQPAVAAQGKPIILDVVTVVPVPANQETSGSLVTDPQTYANVPGLKVMTAQVPVPQAQLSGSVADVPSSSSDPSTAALKGVVVDMGDGRKQNGDGALVWIPQVQAGLDTISLFYRDSPQQPIASGNVPIEQPVGPPAMTSSPPPAEGAENRNTCRIRNRQWNGYAGRSTIRHAQGDSLKFHSAESSCNRRANEFTRQSSVVPQRF